MSRRFWNWQTPESDSPNPDSGVRVLHINGPIAEESWFDDDVTPGLFADELNAASGGVTIWLNSPGGDVVAAAQIYNMLMDYPGHVTVNIDGVAASRLEGAPNTAIKRFLRDHRGLSEHHARRGVDWVLNSLTQHPYDPWNLAKQHLAHDHKEPHQTISDEPLGPLEYDTGLTPEEGLWTRKG